MQLIFIWKQVTTRFRQVWRSPCWSTECTAIRKSTKIRISSSRNASFRRTAPEDIRTLSFRSAPARATASAKSTECSRSKWCCPLWCDDSASPRRMHPPRCTIRPARWCSNLSVQFRSSSNVVMMSNSSDSIKLFSWTHFNKIQFHPIWLDFVDKLRRSQNDANFEVKPRPSYGARGCRFHLRPLSFKNVRNVAGLLCFSGSPDEY